MAKPKNLQVEYVALDKLAPYPRNPRLHSDEQIGQIAASITEFGWSSPIVVDGDYGIIAGHGRALAAQRLGMAKVPVVQLAHLTETQRRALVVAENQIGLTSTWDTELLKLELGELKLAEFDLPLLGFDDLQLVQFLAGPGGADPEATPEPPAEPIVRTGDLWLLGKHRLLCGDATSKADVERLLGGAKPHLMVTDPPYGVNHDPKWREAAGVSTYGPQARGLVVNDDRIDWREAYALFAGDVAYIWHAGRHASTVQASVEAVGFLVRSQIIWAKPQIIFGRGDYHWQHEPCWYAVRKGQTGHWAGDRKQSTLWSIQTMHVMGGARGDDDNPVTGHSTQKPVECMQRPIENNSKPGEGVYDPFVGSGTTLIAAEATARACLAMDIDPTYCEVAIQRWQTYAGQVATLDGDGRDFEIIAEERRKKRSGPEAAPKVVKRKAAQAAR